MSDADQNKVNSKAVASLGYEIYFKIILFGVAMLMFIAITVALIYMAINKYDSSIIMAIGASDGIIALVIGRITKSLFK
jgi:hypothetical protein